MKRDTSEATDEVNVRVPVAKRSSEASLRFTFYTNEFGVIRSVIISPVEAPAGTIGKTISSLAT